MKDMMVQSIRYFRKTGLVIGLFLTAALQAAAKGGGKPAAESALSDPIIFTLVVIIVVLLLAIGLLAFVVRGATDVYREKMKEETPKNSIAPFIITALLLLLQGGLPLMAQKPATAESASAVISAGTVLEGISSTTFYLLTGIIILEMLVLFTLLYNLWILIRIDRKQPAAVKTTRVKKVPLWKSLWTRLNSFKPAEQESDIVLDHDYDGIRELDNRLPPWWLYGFYLTIIVAGVYLWRHHVSHAAPGSVEEYEITMQKAEAEKQAYLKNAANNVNENNVSFLNGNADLEAGKAVFTTVCAACHGKEGEGIVGPNLTDDYWLHGGSIQDIFKVIKYGVPEKGMRSWQDDYSPRQLAQIASYVKSLHGTNPPNPKEKQGELYADAAADPAAVSAAPASASAPAPASVPDQVPAKGAQ